MPQWRSVTVEEMNIATAVDDDLYIEYMNEIHPDERHYLPYYKWLCLKVYQCQPSDTETTSSTPSP